MRARAVQHGTPYAYRKRGCRCEECTAAVTEVAACERAARRARGDQYIRKDRPAATQNVRRPCAACGKTTRSLKATPVCKACVARAKRSLSITPSARRSIYDRDDWTCQFCDVAIDRAAPVNDAWAPTLDHIVPRSKGGSDDLPNLRTLHRYCNQVRSNKDALTLEELAA